MRHLRSILYAIVLAPAVWTLCAVGLSKDLAGRGGTGPGVDGLVGFLLLVLAGAAYALLLLPRLSPTGPAVAGVGYLIATGWALTDSGSFQGLWSQRVTTDDLDLTLPAYGLVAMLAVPLLGTTLSARRWRAGTLVAPGVTADSTGADATQPLPDPARPAANPIVADLAGDETQVIALPEPGDKTQVIALPEPGDKTQVIVLPEPGDKTQVIVRAEPGEKTQVIALPEPGDKTQIIALPEPGDKTQVIVRAEPGDKTQVIPLPEPGDKTQVIPVPEPAAAGTDPPVEPTAVVPGTGGRKPDAVAIKRKRLQRKSGKRKSGKRR